MSLRTDIESDIDSILAWDFKTKEFTTTVPDRPDLTLGKTAGELQTAVLYADVRSSSHLTEAHQRRTVAKILNAFLNSTARVCRSNSGHVRSFNGDSVLVFFEPRGYPEMNAIKSAFEIKYVVNSMLGPAISQRGYEETLDFGIGVASGPVFVTKVGLRGEDSSSDLIWPSTTVNLAAKMGDFGCYPFNILATGNVLQALPNYWLYRRGAFGLPESLWSSECLTYAGQSLTVYKAECYLTVE